MNAQTLARVVQTLAGSNSMYTRQPSYTCQMCVSESSFYWICAGLLAL